MTVKRLMELLKDEDPEAQVSFVAAGAPNDEYFIGGFTNREDAVRSLGWTYSDPPPGVFIEGRRKTSMGDVILVTEEGPTIRRRIFPEDMDRYA